MIHTLHLFRPLNERLISVLKALTPEEWNTKTVAGSWTVKDVAAHLLDGNIRAISLYRDNYSIRPEEAINSYSDLVAFLNRINAEWVRSYKRVSPAVLIAQHEETHESYIRCLENLDLNAHAVFSVAWAGEEVSTNWFHIAREFTEKWHHHQQILDAVKRTGILTKEFYPAVMETFMQALPHHYRDIEAPEGTLVQIEVDSDAGGKWTLQKGPKGWLQSSMMGSPVASVTIPSDLSWRLFTKAVRYPDIKDKITISGDSKFVMPALHMLTVMA